MASTDDHKIRERAHAIWIAEGRPADREAEHWAQAERELRNGAESPPTPGADGPGPDETAETISDNPKSSITMLTEPAPEPVKTEG